MRNEMSAKEKYRRQVKTVDTIRKILSIIFIYIPIGLGVIAISNVVTIAQVPRGIMIIWGIVSAGCFADTRIKYLIERSH